MNPITKANIGTERAERGTTPYTDFSKNLHRLEVKNAVFSGQYTSMRQLQGFDAHTVPKVAQVLYDSSMLDSPVQGHHSVGARQPVAAAIEMTAAIANPSRRRILLRFRNGFLQRMIGKNPATESPLKESSSRKDH